MNFKLIFTFLFFILCNCGVSVPIASNERPISWAKKIELTPLYNLYQVDENLYRSEQPTKEGMTALESLGIKSVVNVRNLQNDQSEGKGTQLNLYKKRINTWTITYDEVIEALKIIQKAPKPILIHCKHGSDRTGCIVAAYRMAFLNWSKEEAIKEFQLGGFGYHEDVFPNVLKLLREIDFTKLKKDLNI
ncbi:MAG: dual specificity protein phosphatase family protein [Flavobacteriia bacterium]|nr:dual specificity protein phosphatase family protein [Flavobacteriia bacterium]